MPTSRNRRILRTSAWSLRGLRLLRSNNMSAIPCGVSSRALNSVTTGQLSRRLARWKYNSGEDAGYLQLDEKTPEALLQLDIARVFAMRSVDGRLWSPDFGWDGAESETPFLVDARANLKGQNREGQYLVGSFGGAPPFAQSKISPQNPQNWRGRRRKFGWVKPWRLPWSNPKKINLGGR